MGLLVKVIRRSNSTVTTTSLAVAQWHDNLDQVEALVADST